MSGPLKYLWKGLEANRRSYRKPAVWPFLSFATRETRPMTGISIVRMYWTADPKSALQQPVNTK